MSRKRIRAHANPLSDVDVDWPLTPDHVSWSTQYPAYIGANNVPLAAALSVPTNSLSTTAPASAATTSPSSRTSLSEVRIADVGCGFGGMTIALGEIYRDKLVLGLEIREKVVEIVVNKIDQLRKDAKEKATKMVTDDSAASSSTSSSSSSSSSEAYHPTESAAPAPAPWLQYSSSAYATATTPPFNYQNISCVRVNFMKYAPNYFRKGQLEKIFFLFADPHFKKSNFRRRVIANNFLDIYAYILQVGGLLYTITDVKDLHDWEVEHLDAHPLFERIPDADLETDPCFIAMHHATDESQKVRRLHGSMYPAVYRRVEAKVTEEE